MNFSVGNTIKSMTPFLIGLRESTTLPSKTTTSGGDNEEVANGS
jgi:hypothetical protein